MYAPVLLLNNSDNDYVANISKVLDVSKYISWDKIKEVSAWILKFKYNLEVKDWKVSSNYLLPDELIKVEEILS